MVFPFSVVNDNRGNRIWWDRTRFSWAASAREAIDGGPRLAA